MSTPLRTEILDGVDAQHARLNAVYSVAGAPAGVTPDALHNADPLGPRVRFVPETLSREDADAGKPGHVAYYTVPTSAGWTGATSSTSTALEASILSYISAIGGTFSTHFPPHVMHVFIAKFAATGSGTILGVAALGLTRVACVDYRTLPGVVAAGFESFALGNTLVHEMGHAFGLPHTFNDTLTLPTDWLSRTNWASYPCPTGTFAVPARFSADAALSLTGAGSDTVCYPEANPAMACPGVTHEEKFNFMNYAFDASMQSFNVDQSAAIRAIADASPLHRADEASAPEDSVFLAVEPSDGSHHYGGKLRVLLSALVEGETYVSASVTVNGVAMPAITTPEDLFGGVAIVVDPLPTTARVPVVITVTTAAATQTITVPNVTILGAAEIVPPVPDTTPIAKGMVISFTIAGAELTEPQRGGITDAFNEFALEQALLPRLAGPGETPAQPGEALVYFDFQESRGYTIVVVTFATAAAATAALAALRDGGSVLLAAVIGAGVLQSAIGNLTLGIFRPAVTTTLTNQWRRVLIALLAAFGFLLVVCCVAFVAARR